MMFKQLYRLQRYTFLHELSLYAYNFLHELFSYTYIFFTRTSFFFHILPQFLVERMLGHRVLVNQLLRISI